MSAKSKLKRALSAIDDAKTALNRVRHNADATTDVRRALSELDDAETHIRKAIRELPDD